MDDEIAGGSVARDRGDPDFVSGGAHSLKAHKSAIACVMKREGGEEGKGRQGGKREMNVPGKQTRAQPCCGPRRLCNLPVV